MERNKNAPKSGFGTVARKTNQAGFLQPLILDEVFYANVTKPDRIFDEFLNVNVILTSIIFIFVVS